MRELLSEIELAATAHKPVPCMWPLYVVAYWPAGQRWKIHPQTFARNDTEMTRFTELLSDRGWTHITVLRLPAELWEQ